ncbi:MFS transporter [Microbacterium awajiense]|uniref:MFS transporter n=1 Tax=Microbacterium awajiense TaxID=415214 RepID=A0ABP7ALD1_9MICO
MTDDRRRSVGLKVLYGDTFTMAVGFYMLVPLLAYHFLEDLLLTIGVVAALTAVRTAAQNGLMPIMGWVADRIDFRRAILAGVLIRASGFALLGTAEHVPVLIVASILTGLGGALFHPASYAAYAALAVSSDRVRVYSTREVISNVGFIVGPLVGGLLAGVDFAMVSLGAAAMFVIAFFISLLGLPSPELAVRERRPSLRLAFSDRPFLRYCLLVVGVAVLITQFYLVIPYRAGTLLPGPEGLGLVYTGAAIVMVITMLPLTGLANRLLPRRGIVAIAVVCLGVGVATIGLAGALPVMLLGVGVFVVGQMLSQPVLNAIVSDFAPDGSVASYFGVQGLATAVGSILGSTLSGVIYPLADTAWAAIAWAVFPVWAAIVATLLWTWGPREQS